MNAVNSCIDQQSINPKPVEDDKHHVNKPKQLNNQYQLQINGKTQLIQQIVAVLGNSILFQVITIAERKLQELISTLLETINYTIIKVMK